MQGLAALATAARRMLPAAVAVAATDPTQPSAPPWPNEVLVNAVPSRLREFAAGRAAVRQALIQLGHPAQSIPQGSDRAPIWPSGIHGSITHSATYCLAAVTRAPQLIGIDIEPAIPLAPDLWDVVLLPAEQAMLRSNPDAPLLAKLIFCAKEAAYKAQYPRSNTLFGFDGMQITLSKNTFTARFTRSVPGFDTGHILHGHIANIAGHFLVAVTH